MELSQNRTQSVLKYCFEDIEVVSNSYKFVREKIMANGLSSSKCEFPANHLSEEDRKRCRKVEFRVRTNAETQMTEILDMIKQQNNMTGVMGDSNN